MRNLNTLGPWLRRFLVEHIVTERNLARNTRKSYRDTFVQLVPFLSRKTRKSAERLAVSDLTSRRVLQFLAHIEDQRGCSAQTRNLRLTAIRAFARFVASRDPAQVAWCGHIRAIPAKKAMPQPIGWLSRKDVDAMVAAPNRKTLRGRTERALLMFLYNTGARVSEAAQLTAGDLQIGRGNGRHALATLHGKGGKTRLCPLLPETERMLADLVRGSSAADPVFLSRHRKPYTRFGIYRLVERCAAQIPSLAGAKVTPHTLRHSIACHLLHSKVDINTVRAWLGHAHIDTTNVYAEIDVNMKARAIALCDLVEPGPSRPWRENKGLMAFLRSL